MYDLCIIGGVAAGYFCAALLRSWGSTLSIGIVESSKNVLQKVRISGGGRCNVTHACYDPKSLTKHYPRGRQELLGPFTRFMTGDTMDWFELHGVPLKVEEDNRVFPISDSSKDIINALRGQAERDNTRLHLQTRVEHLLWSDTCWTIHTTRGTFKAKCIL